MLSIRSKLSGVLAACAGLGMLFSLAVPAAAGSISGTYTLSPSNIDTGFSVRVLGGRPVTGAFNKVSGKMILDQKRPDKSRVNVTIDLSSVSTNNDKVTGFLKSSAMFNVAKYPTAIFQSTRIRITGKYSAEVEGVLSLRGKRQRTKLAVTITGNQGNGRVGFEVSGGFFRSLYGMDAGLPIYADKVNIKISGSGRRG
ncbi:YceI family protein [uncultured Roseibium sp.]|uniref:YceI family protein n=1 Tax=uncultured Roseibium sp. TaxID=1936171 RepID=UPI00260F7E87|nr:YceI family protein [uncultured Roseibium sp.]